MNFFIGDHLSYADDIKNGSFRTFYNIKNELITMLFTKQAKNIVSLDTFNLNSVDRFRNLYTKKE